VQSLDEGWSQSDASPQFDLKKWKLCSIAACISFSVPKVLSAACYANVAHYPEGKQGWMEAGSKAGLSRTPHRSSI
jgi:hypothetical protein